MYEKLGLDFWVFYKNCELPWNISIHYSLWKYVNTLSISQHFSCLIISIKWIDLCTVHFWLIHDNELNIQEFREFSIFVLINLAAESAALISFGMHYCNTARLFKGKEAKAYSFLFFSSSLFSSTKTISSGPRTVSTTQVGFSSTFFHANGELVRAELNLHGIVPFRKDFYNFPKQCPSILGKFTKTSHFGFIFSLLFVWIYCQTSNLLFAAIESIIFRGSK